MSASRPAGALRAAATVVPVLHVVTDDAVLARGDYLDVATDLLHQGGPRLALHVRGPRTPGGVLLRHVQPLVAEARLAGAWLVVNDRVDVARVAGLDAVHLGRRSLPLDLARNLLGPGARVGCSVHSGDEALAAGAPDWIFAGTIYPSASHPGRPGAGPSRLAEVRQATPGTPVFAIGGVTLERVADVASAGAAGVAVIQGVWGHENPVHAARLYLESWPELPQPSKEPE